MKINGILKQALENHWNKEIVDAQGKLSDTSYRWRVYEYEIKLNCVYIFMMQNITSKVVSYKIFSRTKFKLRKLHINIYSTIQKEITFFTNK